MLQISPGRNCRMYPYIKGAGCDRAIDLCKSDLVYLLPGGALQGAPVGTSVREAASGCGARTMESYGRARSGYYNTVFPRCVNSVHPGGCRCDQSGRQTDDLL